MKVAIIGAGVSGRAIARELTGRGVDARTYSRSSGFDVTQAGTAARIPAVDAVVEATGTVAMGGRAAGEFFTASTRTAAAVARASGARHVLLSILHCDAPAVRGFGYYAAKAAQERVARQESENLTIVRTTQWFEFARQTLARSRIGPLAFVPAMLVQPIAVDTVAGVIADVATGARTGPLHEIAGPEVMTLRALVGRLPAPVDGEHLLRVPVPLPGRFGRAFRTGALIAAADTEILGPTLAEWLATQAD
ncbi:NADH(P)-binding protein [Pseudactinotalea sp. HY160]|uniref:SDR family oxidoreductase n=1 Tax=Pseudactinotalea sp. HY160 TaxID=2654490 RepID=UPI00128C898C|nr:SDR family oxidoreductase [Pseudactinotalea sp. HY160]MPV51291.1 NADH(P)-binding protein [Pseudactinotalea sp. HY160]